MNAIPTFVGTLVQVALLVQIVPKLLHRFGVARLGGAHEVGVRDVEHFPRVAEGRLHGVAPFLRGHALAGGGIGDLLAVLVHAGNKSNVVAVHALVARHGVGGNGGVSSAQMGRGIHVIDRRRKRISSLGHMSPPLGNDIGVHGSCVFL